ncbi:ABC transporter permease [Streptomyces cavernae]|uniref:ABC transporter permease n=1 Tax=Streptomyces cavernae TaxID=2259034 RepID=UPI000FEB878C|nr:ABC transporter permease [Streptomyces cavernae]
MSTPQPPQHAAAPTWQTPPGHAYTSPIPVKKTNLGHAIASEWTKIKSVRSTMWTLGIFLLLVVGIGFLVAVNTSDTEYGDVPYTIPAFFGLILGQICLITLGVLVIASEYGTGMIRTTFTASPQRHRVLAAKFIVFFAVAFSFSVLAITLVGLITQSLHGGESSVSWGGTVFKGGLYVSLLGVLSLAVGAMLRHSAGAIATMLAVVLVPAILPAFLMLSATLRSIGNTMQEYAAPNALAYLFGIDSDNNTGNPQLLFLVGVTAAAVAGAFLLLDRRDV